MLYAIYQKLLANLSLAFASLLSDRRCNVIKPALRFQWQYCILTYPVLFRAHHFLMMLIPVSFFFPMNCRISSMSSMSPPLSLSAALSGGVG
jgi:hypothetical protein